MNADEFASLLAELGQACPPRARKPEPRDNPLEDLVVRYDCARLAIGRIRFSQAPRPHHAGTMLGFHESSHLVLLPSGEVWAFEHERFGEPLLGCAVDAAHFLDALAGFMRMCHARAQWLPELDAAARVCADLAGGACYDDFYLGLVGYLEYGASA